MKKISIFILLMLCCTGTVCFGLEASISGTGFIITKDGYILTCHHVIQDALEIKIIAGGNTYPAELILDDPNNNLALLKINGSFSAIPFSSNHSGKMGQEVFTIGYPNSNLQGINAKFNKGNINSLTGIQDDLRFYQISIPVQPGNSGGPLMDKNGNILGIIVAKLELKTDSKIAGALPQNANYAVKSIYAQAMLGAFPEISNKLIAPSKSESDAIDRTLKSTVIILSSKNEEQLNSVKPTDHLYVTPTPKNAQIRVKEITRPHHDGIELGPDKYQIPVEKDSNEPIEADFKLQTLDQTGKLKVGIFPFKPDKGSWHSHVVDGIGDFLFSKKNEQLYSVASFYDFKTNSNVSNNLKFKKKFTILKKQSMSLNNNSISLKDLWITKGSFLTAKVMPNMELIKKIGRNNNFDLVIMSHINIQRTGWPESGVISLFLINLESGKEYSVSDRCSDFAGDSREISFKLVKKLFNR